ncbi:microtubule-associated protein futsch isoform X2 [Larimichthys crocea]|uniref:microtubule-associated protein futsch isoform X2 n=1 Tax=Larimichthys crocea TaxID=215358 RepID=UPI000F5F7539|nr:microtubule-associated protein futsch isoform X2 [Larimichthys crocea]
MEACMTKPDVKKKPKPPKPPPKPAEIKNSDPERPQKPAPLMPPRPSDAELSRTQYRRKNAAATNNKVNGDLIQRETKEKPSETPVVPPRPTEKEMKATTKYSQRRKSSRENAQSKDEADFKQSNQRVLPGVFRRSQKEKTPAFTSYVIDDGDKEEKKTDDVPAKQAPAIKPRALKGVMKGLQIKTSPKASRDPSPDPGTEEAGGEKKEQPAEKNKREKNAEPKQDIGDLIAGIFRKTPKEKSSLPTVTLSKPDSDSEDAEEAEEKSSEQSQEKGSFFSGILKKTNKTTDETPAQEYLSVNKELSASSDSLSENKEKGGIFSGMFKKSPKPTEAAQTDEDRRSLHDDLSGSNDNLSETSKEKGGFFSGILRKSPKIPTEGTPGQDKQSLQTDPSDSNETESENNTTKEKGNVFSGMFKKSPKLSGAPRLKGGAESLHSDFSASTDSLSENKEKGGLFSGLLRKTKTAGEENLLAQNDLSASSDSLSEAANTKEKGGAFSGIFKKSSKPADAPSTEEENQPQDDELSGSSEAPSENTKEKGGIFGEIFKKAPKAAEAARPEEDESPDKELSTSDESLSENKQEKSGGLFSGLLKKTPREKAESPDRETQRELSASNDDLPESNTTKEKNIFSNMFKKPQKAAEGAAADKENLLAQNDLPASSDSLSEAANTKEKNIFSNMFKKPQKPAEGAADDKESEANSEYQLSASCENLLDATATKEKKGGLANIFKRSSSIENLFDEEKGGLFSGLKKKTQKASGEEAAAEDKDELTASNDSLSENSGAKEKSIFSGMFKKHKPADGATTDEELDPGEDNKLSENLLEVTSSKEKTGGLAGIFRKSPKPAPRSIVTKDPLSDTKELSSSCDSLNDADEDYFAVENSTENLVEAAGASKEKKGGFAGIFRRTPKTVEDSEDMEPPVGGGLRRRRTIKKKRRVVSFRVKTTLPKMPKLGAQSSDKMPIVEEVVELQDLNPAQESSVEVQLVEMAAYPTEETRLESEQETDELIEWWNTVKGWAEWNEMSNFQEDDEQMAMEQAADRVYMAARLFVRLFNQRGASLQHRILELLALADAADQFHKKTVKAAVGGGVASVAGSVATITGLILAPFTFGASIIVTAVGIGVATAGSITSATANITDTVHSSMDRKKLEKMIQGYQEEIKDIRECLEFVQAGMDTLQEWDFEKYSESAAKKALNHNLKHVMKEGGRAGKALMINTDKLISTVQVLGAAGGAAKAAQAISVTTGVMSALFLALDVFFLAKDSHELRKGAKTKFATKIRDVCKELQDGLLELNKVKTQLQKTMDGIEVEEFEEIEEVEVEVDDDDLESDPKKLAELEQELDLMEEKLDKKREEEEEQKKNKEMEQEKIKSKKEKKEKEETEKKKEEEKNKEEEEKKKKEQEEEQDDKKEGKGEEKSKSESKLEKISDEEKEAVKVEKEVSEEQSQKGKKKDKEAENRLTAGKEKYESRQDAKEDNGTNKKTDEKEREETKRRSGESKREEQSGKAYSERAKTERESERSKSGREDERVTEKQKDAEVRSTRRHSSSRSDKDGHHRSERGSRHEARDKERGSSRHSDRTEERGVKDWRAEERESKEVRQVTREDHGRGDVRKESHRSHKTEERKEHSERESGRRGEESRSKRSHHEKRESRIESARRQFEKAGGDDEKEKEEQEERRKRREERERRGSDRDREHGHSRRGSQSRSSVLLDDGLYI